MDERVRREMELKADKNSNISLMFFNFCASEASGSVVAKVSSLLASSAEISPLELSDVFRAIYDSRACKNDNEFVISNVSRTIV